MILIILFLLIAIFLTFFLFFRKSRDLGRTNKIFKLNKRNFYTWMNFSKNERYDLAKKESRNYMNKRKNLLKEIRNEYKNISSLEKNLD